MKPSGDKFAQHVKKFLEDNRYELVDGYMTENFNPDNRLDVVESTEYRTVEVMVHQMLNNIGHFLK